MLIKSIKHFSDEHFAHAFRDDLSDAERSIVVFSPFLSKNRAAYYAPVFNSLRMRSVEMHVFAKPQSEQPEWLQGSYDEIVSQLKRLGVWFHTRVGMHEKLAIIDEEVLWHGSLNILSHYDTRESMLRLESEDLVAEIVTSLSIDPHKMKTDASNGLSKEDFLQDSTAQLAAGHACPLCGNSMSWFADAGLWICVRAPQCSGTTMGESPVSSDDAHSNGELRQELVLPCPNCMTPMELRRGPFMRVACPAPDCGFSLDPRLSAWIARSLKRRQKP
ncbi:phospholipase D-like domain-containing protein [Desulforhabdus sp. TSK]|uniref:phospholipase D-like domain-containing protein n=1 Tax=Desulforhabdus sp. TSK TaxID=2925014 RepID=UPI001FC83EC6|nr:phospholipase D-like domain-containing protein [Desulforhabdus sp. TSK]GKT10090.1 hypothetical protein DSTSK_33950 [Desulforhabdus sp. TSK]